MSAGSQRPGGLVLPHMPKPDAGPSLLADVAGAYKHTAHLAGA